MKSYVVDTHALFWYFTASPRLGKGARRAFIEGTRRDAVIYVPAIVLAELFFLNEKYGRLLDFSAEFQRISRSGQFVFVAFQAEHVLDFAQNSTVSEMHDRIIAGVAHRLGAICITRDPSIISSGDVATVWD